ncbi:MAG: hypothetical protein FJW19_03635, partial [Actinobacteria bacterium]|nr:hypothetical protein [Actinomycetota bacterium]
MVGGIHAIRKLRLEPDDELSMFLGEDILAWMVIALGGAMFAGHLAALIRPPKVRRDADDLTKAPVVRSVVMATIGA